MKWYHTRYPVMIRKSLARIKFYLTPNPGVVVDPEKIEINKAIAKKYPSCKIFIETGTFLGGMVEALHDQFEVAHTIELDSWLYEKSKKRLAKYTNIVCHFGDSGDVLKELLPFIQSPIIYWLDAHYSFGITGKGIDFNPLMRELQEILKHRYINESVILIDDARAFDGTEPDVPTIEYLKTYIKKEWPAATLGVKDDIIRIHQ